MTFSRMIIDDFYFNIEDDCDAVEFWHVHKLIKMMISCSPIMFTNYVHELRSPIMFINYVHQLCSPIMFTNNVHKLCSPINRNIENVARSPIYGRTRTVPPKGWLSWSGSSNSEEFKGHKIIKEFTSPLYQNLKGCQISIIWDQMYHWSSHPQTTSIKWHSCTDSLISISISISIEQLISTDHIYELGQL